MSRRWCASGWPLLTRGGGLPDPPQYVSLVPTQVRQLLDEPGGRDVLAGFRAILLGGAAVPAGLRAEAAAAGARVITTYGMSETCGGCVYDGAPLDGVSARIGPGGRIELAGPVLFSGYRGRPDLTAAPWTAAGSSRPTWARWTRRGG